MRQTSMTLLALALTCGVVYAAEVVPSTIDQPGTQPGEVTNLQPLNRCDDCRAGYDAAVEPVFNWQGSMMASAGRDPIFWGDGCRGDHRFAVSTDELRIPAVFFESQPRRQSLPDRRRRQHVRGLAEHRNDVPLRHGVDNMA